MSDNIISIPDLTRDHPDLTKKVQNQFQRLMMFKIPVENQVEAFLSRDPNVELELNNLQKEFNTSISIDDLYLLYSELTNNLKAIDVKKEKGVYDKLKTAEQESERFIEILNRIQNGDVQLKSVKLELKKAPKKYHFESDEIMQYFIKGIASQFSYFIENHTEFERIQDEVSTENKEKYKQGKKQGRQPYVKTFLKMFLQFISDDKALESDTTTSNRKMLFIARFCKNTEVINPNNDLVFDDSDNSLIKYIRNIILK